MQGLDYKIENDHLYVACDGQSSWHFIGSLRGVIHARLIENTQAGVALPGGPGNRIILELNFPERGMVVFNIPYNSTAEAAKALNKAEQLVKDLIDFSRKKQVSEQKADKVTLDLLEKHFYTLLEKHINTLPKCVSGNHN